MTYDMTLTCNLQPRRQTMYYIVIDCNTQGTASEAAGSRFLPVSRRRGFVLQYHTIHCEEVFVLQSLTSPGSYKRIQTHCQA